MRRKLLILALSCAVAFVLGLCACGSSDEPAPEEEASTQAISVMEESSQQGVLDATGIDLPAPAGAKEVEYYLYKLDVPLGEVRFVLEGKPMFIRAQATDLVDIPISAEAIITALEEGEDVYNAGDISGLYYTWTTGTEATVAGRPAEAFTTDEEGGVGLIMWVDVAPGILYNLGIKEGATQDLLVQTAEAAFVPVQGDVG